MDWEKSDLSFLDEFLIKLTNSSSCPFEYIGIYSPREDLLNVFNRAVEHLLDEGEDLYALYCFEFVLQEMMLTPLNTFTKDVIDAVKTGIYFVRRRLAPGGIAGKRIFHKSWSNTTNDVYGIPHYPDPHTPLPRKLKKDRAIQVWDDALTTDQCSRIVELFENSNHYEGNILRNGELVIDFKGKKTTEFDITGSAPTDKHWAAVERLAVYTTRKYLLKYEAINVGVKNLINPLGDGGYQMKRYKPLIGDHHSYHVDSGNVPACGYRRLIAFLLYLSDVEEGGETVFLTQGIAVKPKCGRVLMFPTSFPYLHAGRSPRLGIKYNIITFLVID